MKLRLSTLELKDPEFLLNWDFDLVWAVDADSNSGYPFLRTFQNYLVTSDEVADLDRDSVTLNGQILSEIKTDSEYSFLLSKTSNEVNFANYDAELVVESDAISPLFNSEDYSAAFTNLDCGTSYDYIFIPTLNFFGEIDYDQIKSFETTACPSSSSSGSRMKSVDTDSESMTYEQEVEKAIEIELITKDPLAQVNKCEALTMMARAYNWDLSSTDSATSQVTDVPSWCQQVATFAFGRGVVEGRELNLLGLDSFLSRYEMAVMIHRELALQEFDFQANAIKGAKIEFVDQLAEWASAQVTALAKVEFVKGFSDGNFGGGSPVIKQDFAVVLLRSIEG